MSYVRAMGGELKLMVAFPGTAPVALEGLGETEEPQRVRRANAQSKVGKSGPQLVSENRTSALQLMPMINWSTKKEASRNTQVVLWKVPATSRTKHLSVKES